MSKFNEQLDVIFAELTFELSDKMIAGLKREIKSLILQEVVGEDEPETSSCSHGELPNGMNIFENQFKAKQRLIVKGGK